jgi:hypothetical protein
MESKENLPLVKIFVNNLNKATICCPKCNSLKIIDATTLKATAKKVKISCKCGEVFRAFFEFRRSFRKAVTLDGKYKALNRPKRGNIVVKDLSVGGIGFSCNPAHNIKPGDLLEVAFTLNDPQRSTIVLKIRVQHAKDGVIGAAWTDKISDQPALGFYLM